MHVKNFKAELHVTHIIDDEVDTYKKFLLFFFVQNFFFLIFLQSFFVSSFNPTAHQIDKRYYAHLKGKKKRCRYVYIGIYVLYPIA